MGITGLLQLLAAKTSWTLLDLLSYFLPFSFFLFLSFFFFLSFFLSFFFFFKFNQFLFSADLQVALLGDGDRRWWTYIWKLH
ncbi:hypothetical protein, partial [Streptococcus pneumoniae]